MYKKKKKNLVAILHPNHMILKQNLNIKYCLRREVREAIQKLVISLITKLAENMRIY